MYIIRDPQDPSFSPVSVRIEYTDCRLTNDCKQVREILDKKTSVQLYKLFISATMYLSVMAIPLGGMLVLLRASGLSMLPLRWSFRCVLTHLRHKRAHRISIQGFIVDCSLRSPGVLAILPCAFQTGEMAR